MLMLAGDAQGNLHRLFIIQSRIHCRLVRSRKIAVLKATRTAGTFGDIFTGKLKMYATENTAH